MSTTPDTFPSDSPFRFLEKPGYERVMKCEDRATGLRSLIAVHSTKRGPSLGGCRFYSYPDEESALLDVLRLARAMTYKAALAELPLGGGKAVIFGNPETDKNEALWKSFGKFVNQFDGTYITTEDSGTSPADMNLVRRYTRHVVGTSSAGGGSDDPSPFTALGVAAGIRACVEFVFGSPELRGKTIAIQGVGHVGFPLARLLSKAGAKLVISDRNQSNVEKAQRECNATIVDPAKIYEVLCDVFAPCAMGGALSESTISRLQCRIVAGAANNQLATDADGERLRSRGIVYAPDFAINAGGLINVGREIVGYSDQTARDRAEGIQTTVAEILRRSASEKTPPERIAMRMAEERLA